MEQAFTLTWEGLPKATYRVEWTPTLSNPMWQALPGDVFSPTAELSFTDDGSKTGGLGQTRFYRVLKTSP
jgi:hypothetical protein